MPEQTIELGLIKFLIMQIPIKTNVHSQLYLTKNLRERALREMRVSVLFMWKYTREINVNFTWGTFDIPQNDIPQNKIEC